MYRQLSPPRSPCLDQRNIELVLRLLNVLDFNLRRVAARIHDHCHANRPFGSLSPSNGLSAAREWAFRSTFMTDKVLKYLRRGRYRRGTPPQGRLIRQKKSLLYSKSPVHITFEAKIYEFDNPALTPQNHPEAMERGVFWWGSPNVRLSPVEGDHSDRGRCSIPSKRRCRARMGS